MIARKSSKQQKLYFLLTLFMCKFFFFYVSNIYLAVNNFIVVQVQSKGDSTWKCDDGLMISSSWKCDGTTDCDDGSDETLKLCGLLC